MFGLRYHVASLAAVFVALAAGILLGVAISGKVDDAQEGLQEELLREENERLEQELEGVRAEAEAAIRRGAASEDLVERAYPALMAGRLEGRNVALIFLGALEGGVSADVERALVDANAGLPPRVVSLELPLDRDDLEATLEADESLAAYADEGDFSELGHELARELVGGGETPVWNALSTRLVEERSGPTSLPLDAVVVVATWQPAEASDGDADPDAASESTTSLLEGLVGGMEAEGIPVVGVASTGDPADRLEFYRSRGISSVDDVETQAGRLALALLLAGAEPGSYGIGEDTDGVVPPIEPLTVEGE